MHRVHEVGDDNIASFYESVVFQEGWFGPMGAVQDGYAITSGVTSRLVSLSPSHWQLNSSDVLVTNGYGLLRSSWNVAKDPRLIPANVTMGYVTQYISAPRCAMFYSAMNMTDIVDFTRFAQSNAHGAIHTIIGGVSNVDWKPYFRDMNFTLGEELGLQGFGMVKRLWRSGQYPTNGTRWYWSADLLRTSERARNKQWNDFKSHFIPPGGTSPPRGSAIAAEPTEPSLQAH